MATRKPAKICRRMGRSQLRKVARATLGRAAHDAPRSTLYSSPKNTSEYSDVFFGEAHKVLRGASWAARPSVARATFRNWDLPIRRQIFAGFRVAADRDGGRDS